ncbi:MAG: MotA/TolQ/ExbB proton channel family protein [Oceanococcus sp.]
MRTIKTLVVAALCSAVMAPAFAQNADPLMDLLKQTKNARAQEQAENTKREQRFKANRNEQVRLLSEAKADKAATEQRSEELIKSFETNEKQLSELETLLNQKIGQLGEMFGVVRQVAGDLRGIVGGSYTSTQPDTVDRAQFLEALGRSKELPSIEKLEGLWFELQREMTESGRVVKYQAPTVNPDGTESQREVIRVGSFVAVSEGKFLIFPPDTDKLTELTRQPQGRFLSMAEDLQNADQGPVRMAIDPTRGALLSVIVQAPSLAERISQGAEIGYLIIALGIFGLLLAIERFVTLFSVGSKMNAQRGNAPRDDNPLGRVLLACESVKNADLETIESKLDEAIIKETPQLEKRLSVIKIMAAVAPLMGLLGTVTGMIVTFQAITLFGTGDPKLMAGGISQALVTTVLGLVVAIPMVFLHSVLAARSKSLIQILEEESAGLVAQRSETSGTA